jgi:cytochrome c-type biogenesis protein
VETIFTALNHAVTGAPFVALAAATAWGILSIVLSPCHLASIPLIVGFIDGQGRMSTGRAFLISSLFSVGILLTIALVGLLTAAAGRMLGDVGPWGNWLVALIFFVVGLHLLDLIPLPWAGASPVGMARKGLLAAFFLGLIFGIALGPCTFAFLAPMLGVTFSLGSDRMLFGAALLLAYGIGHCSVIVLAGTFTEVIQRYLNWTERSRGALLLKKICGVLVIFGGVWMIYAAP